MYKNKTSHYGIPYISKGEIMEAAEEKKAAQIIDNMIYASTFGVAKCVFEDGNYRIQLNNDGLYTLSIVPYNGYSMLGILNYCLFSSKNTLKIEGLRSGNEYFIYIVYRDGLSTDPEHFYLTPSTYKYPDESILSIHVATIDLTGIQPVINEEPYSRKYTTNVIGHINDTSNPHGRILHQDELQVVENLYVCGNKVYPYEFVELKLEQNKSTYELSFLSNIVFVTYMSLSEPQKIWFEINKEKLIVHTEGKSGKIKIKTEFE